MRGRGHGVGIRGRGRGRGSSQVQSTVGGGATASRPGSQLKNIRYSMQGGGSVQGYSWGTFENQILGIPVCR